MAIDQGATALRWTLTQLHRILVPAQQYASMLSSRAPRFSKRAWLLLTGFVLVLLLGSYSATEQHETVKTFGSGLKDTLTNAIINDDQIIELEGITIGKAITIDKTSPNSLIGMLKARFRDLASNSYQPEYVECSLSPSRYEKLQLSRSALWKTKGTVGIAINLHNSQSIIPSQAVAVLQAAEQLLRHNRVYISIYENNSADKTGPLLSELAAAAAALGVHGIFMTSSRMRNGDNQDRMVMLSEIRNHAVAPLIPYLSKASSNAATLVLMNDVVTCASDILELVHQQRLQSADMVMGVDWLTVDGQPRLYDLWVARGINGALAYTFAENHGINPISTNNNYVHDTLSTQQKHIFERWLDGRPVPVYCMWGGMVALDAALFTKRHLRFRSSIKSGWTGGSAAGALGDWGKLVTASYMETDCPGASECEYICRDIWNLKHGDARILLAPQARTTYSSGEWDAVVNFVPAKLRTDRDDDNGDLVNWAEVKIPSSVECIPSRTMQGEQIDCWGAERYRLDPYWKMVFRFLRW